VCNYYYYCTDNFLSSSASLLHMHNLTTQSRYRNDCIELEEFRLTLEQTMMVQKEGRFTALPFV
jgi:hypothetical protein